MFLCTRWRLSYQVVFLNQPVVLCWPVSFICVCHETKSEQSAKIETANLVGAELQAGAGAGATGAGFAAVGSVQASRSVATAQASNNVCFQLQQRAADRWRLPVRH